MAALINPGDEVIIPTPYWVTYSEQPRLVGGESVIVETRVENGLKLTPDEFRRAITPRTRMLYLCSPSNPSGSVYAREELESLAAVAVEHGIYILSDEIYEKLVYDEEIDTWRVYSRDPLTIHARGAGLEGLKTCVLELI